MIPMPARSTCVMCVIGLGGLLVLELGLLLFFRMFVVRCGMSSLLHMLPRYIKRHRQGRSLVKNGERMLHRVQIMRYATCAALAALPYRFRACPENRGVWGSVWACPIGERRMCTLHCCEE